MTAPASHPVAWIVEDDRAVRVVLAAALREAGFVTRDFADAEHGAPLKQAMLDHYLPIQGPSFQEWIDNNQDDGAVGVRILADKMFTFHLEESQ